MNLQKYKPILERVWGIISDGKDYEYYEERNFVHDCRIIKFISSKITTNRRG